MASDLVINKYNVNMVVVDDVQLRFETGDYKIEQEIFGFLLLDDNEISAHVYEDVDKCYKEYYFYNMQPTKYTSIVFQHVFILEHQDDVLIATNKHNFEEWLLSQTTVIELLQQIASKVAMQPLILTCDLNQDIMQDYSMIDLLLERKINLGKQFNIEKYLQLREEAYNNDIYCTVYGNEEKNEIFIDKRISNVVKQRDVLNMAGIDASGLMFFHSVTNKLLYQLKSDNVDRIANIKKRWSDIKNVLRDIDNRNIQIEKINGENMFYENTYQKYKAIFHLKLGCMKKSL